MSQAATGGREDEIRSGGRGSNRAIIERTTRKSQEFRLRGPIRTLEECAAILGCSLQSVSYGELRALAKIRAALIEHGVVDENGRYVREAGE